MEIFRPGKHVSADGREIEFTEQDLQAAAAAYDPELHEAPLVIGHPKDNAPAYGWVRSLRFEDLLYAEPHQVDPEFAEIVNAGRYKKRSASFYAPDSKSNPKPGAYYLRHVGFLGAQPPAVKGQRDYAFSDDGDAVTIEFGERERWGFDAVARAFRTLREWIIERDGVEVADQAIPEYYIRDAEQAAQPDEPANAMFADPGTPIEEDDMAGNDTTAAPGAQNQDADFAERERLIKEREDKTAAREREFARREVTEFVEQLAKDGRILPRDQAGLVEYLANADAEAVIEFGEGDQAHKGSSVDWLKKFLEALPAQVDFKERGAGGDDAVDTTDPNAIAARAVEFVEAERKAGRTVSITQAVARVTKGDQK